MVPELTAWPSHCAHQNTSWLGGRGKGREGGSEEGREGGCNQKVLGSNTSWILSFFQDLE